MKLFTSSCWLVTMKHLACYWTKCYKNYYFTICINLSRKHNFISNLSAMSGILHKWIYACIKAYGQFFLKLEMFQAKFVQKIRKHILYLTRFSKLPFMKCGKKTAEGNRRKYNTALGFWVPSIHLALQSFGMKRSPTVASNISMTSSKGGENKRIEIKSYYEVSPLFKYPLTSKPNCSNN